MDPVVALGASGGVAEWRALRRQGVPWHALDRARASGLVLRLGRGTYALPGADPALVAAVRLGGVLALGSAAAYHRLRILHRPAGPTVLVPRAWSHARLEGVDVLRVDLRPGDVDGLATSRERTALDCARRLPLRDAVVVIDSAVRAGVDAKVLHHRAAGMRGPGAAAARRAVALLDERCESLLETCVRLVLVDLGVPFRSQVLLHGVGRVDFLVAGRLVVEADGFAHHSDRESYRADRRRLNALSAQGYVLLRFTYEDVVHSADRVAALVLAALRRAA